MRRRLLRAGVVLVVAAAAVLGIHSTKDDMGLGRNMEIMVNMMRELNLQYVDEVSPDKLMGDGAQGMVRNLDPYTQYMSEEEMTDFEVMATGKYGGIGATIRMKRDSSGVVISQPYKGSPSDLAGLKIGDKFVRIDDEDVTKCTTAEVSSRLKGTPGTKVKLAIKRLMTGKVEEMEITRARIAIPGVPYAGFLEDGIAYIRHADFSDGCYDDMRAMVERLRQEQTIRGVVLDYRDNGGGSVSEAVKILSMFVPKGEKVLEMKGRTERSKREYRTESVPVLGDVPVVALISPTSASASEIVCGALQDLDRAVLMGQRSYGKGLVQSVVPLGYNAYLKLTTAKYYIPSGRCVQRISYNHDDNQKDENLPDSLINEFSTRNGRKVYDGKGLMPDVKIEPEYISTFAVMLYNLGYIEDYLDEWMRKHPNMTIDNKTFSISDEDYEAFVKFMADKDVPYQSQTRDALEQLKKRAKDERYDDAFAEDLKQIESKLKDQKADNLRHYRREITDLINSDVVLRHNYYEGVVEYNLRSDSTVRKAVELLRDGERYKEILTKQDTQRN
ncbi:MAG: S41 family peptidase [Rikenellaceae bacterium]|nr:S41 family peptidase [Rikenellaceae bacterium]MBQ8544653.1 S41 family peptidase [Alistipes sp.]MBR3702628.1 S41 family peptidase [Alistipes sp.]